MENIFNWNTSDNIKIHAYDWHIEKPKAVFCLVHGFGEHCERYHHVAAEFNKNGYAMIGYDRRGHGKSGGKRGHTTGLDAFLDEITELQNQATQRYPGVPVCMYGHSMGGNLTLNYILKRKPNIVCAITTGTWVQLTDEVNGVLKGVLRGINKIYPSFSQTVPLDASKISSMPEEAKKYADDPLNHGEMTAATAVTMFDAAKYLENYKSLFPVPLLMMHGGNDRIINIAYSRLFAEQVKGDVTFKEFPDQAHEIHYDRTRAEVFATTMDWLAKHLA